MWPKRPTLRRSDVPRSLREADGFVPDRIACVIAQVSLLVFTGPPAQHLIRQAIKGRQADYRAAAR